MKYFAYTYNYITLHKAIVYGVQRWGSDNTFIIYSSFVSSPPKGLLLGKYNNYIIGSAHQEGNSIINKLPTVSTVAEEKRLVAEILKYIKKIEPDTTERICLVVFRDTILREALLIGEIKRKYKNAEITLIEEGLALYAKHNPPNKSLKNLIRKVIYKMTNVPVWTLSNLPFGNNLLVDRIICAHPQLLKEMLLNRNVVLEQEVDMYSKENCDRFLREVLMENVSDENFNFVFLSQPLFPVKDEKKNEKYRDFLRRFLELLSTHGTVMIKKHPRDTYDYSMYLSDRVVMCPEAFSKCAYEFLSAYYNHPQPITLYSSAAINVNTEKPIIFLYDFFPEIIDANLFTEQFIKDNKIIRCKTFDEIEKNLYI